MFHQCHIISDTNHSFLYVNDDVDIFIENVANLPDIIYNEWRHCFREKILTLAPQSAIIACCWNRLSVPRSTWSQIVCRVNLQKTNPRTTDQGRTRRGSIAWRWVSMFAYRYVAPKFTCTHSAVLMHPPKNLAVCSIWQTFNLYKHFDVFDLCKKEKHTN